MLRELGPENPIVEGRILLFGAAWFLFNGLNYKRIAGWVQRRTGQSDEKKALGITIMRPAAFVMSAFCLYLAFKFLVG